MWCRRFSSSFSFYCSFALYVFFRYVFFFCSFTGATSTFRSYFLCLPQNRKKTSEIACGASISKILLHLHTLYENITKQHIPNKHRRARAIFKKKSFFFFVHLHEYSFFQAAKFCTTNLHCSRAQPATHTIRFMFNLLKCSIQNTNQGNAPLIYRLFSTFRRLAFEFQYGRTNYIFEMAYSKR